MILLLCLLITGCSVFTNDTPTVTTTCSIPSDQSGTVSGRWPTNPVPIAFHTGDFGSAEIGAMIAAIDTWNTFFQAVAKISPLSYGNASSPTMSSIIDHASNNTLCGQSVLQNSAFTGNVVIYKLGTWPAAYSSSAIALTSFCTTPGTLYPNFFMAVMEINYQDYFVQGQRLPDLQSIVLHELGHVLGLNHTCENFSKSGTPLCTESNLNPAYASASMYPIFSFDITGAGQVKRTLGTNDESRANCLYPNAIAQ